MKFNPLAGILPMIAQIVIFLALYQVLRAMLQPGGVALLYSFVPNPGEISTSFLRIFDLSKPNAFFAIMTGVSQFFSSKLTFSMQKKTLKKKDRQTGGKDQMESFQKAMQNQMIYFLPAMTIFIVWSLPSALSLYWFFSTLIGIFQQKMITRESRANFGKRN